MTEALIVRLFRQRGLGTVVPPIVNPCGMIARHRIPSKQNDVPTMLMIKTIVLRILPIFAKVCNAFNVFMK